MKLFKMTNGNNVVFFEAYDAKEATEKAVKYADHSKAVRIDEIKERIEFTRVNNDGNGNPRYVCHFLSIPMNKEELEEINIPKPRIGKYGEPIKDNRFSIERQYEKAVAKARTIGGRKFHNKQYGGGIVFQSYNTTDLEISILKLKG